MLIISIIDVTVYVIIALRSSVGLFIFSSESCLLDSIVARMRSNYSSDFLSIELPPFWSLEA